MNILEPLYQSIFPIIFYDNDDKVNVAGTSILVDVNDNQYLITAAHVLKGNGSKYQLYVLLADKAIRLHEPAFMNKLPTTKNDPDLDIAYFPLSRHPTLTSCLNGYKTISLREFDGNIQYHREHFFVFGYPWRRAKFSRVSDELSVRPLQYFTDNIDDESLHQKLSRPKDSHILVQYNPKNTKNRDGNKQQAPHPHGISGGPLFRALVDGNDEVILLILEGLLIEWKQSQVVVATRKSIIRDFIESHLWNGNHITI
jgi:hypothetical protein